jgi:nucleoside phosphorylase
MSAPTPPHSRRSFKVAIICALPLEAEKVRAVFDTCWEDKEMRYGQIEGDPNAYSTGVIGKHNVVLVHMAGMGSTNASAVAAHLRHSFPHIQLAVVVGICGVAPIHPETKEEIVLGDVVISTSVIQYDFGRRYPNGFQRKKEIEDSLGRASPQIRSLIRMLQTRPNHARLMTNLATILRSKSFQETMPDAKYPGSSQDKLYEASYIHRHRLGVDCDQCRSDRDNCSKSCDEVGCERARLVRRHRHSLPETPSLHPDHAPFIHFGKFGSANTVMKSAIDRDQMVTTDLVAAFEMEGAGVWDQHPTVVIKAACDYADSHKSKKWQAHAATMAAACLKVFLNEWSIPDQLMERGNVFSV